MQADEMESALGAALKKSGMDLPTAAFYLKRGSWVGQVGFAHGEKNQERLSQLKSARTAYLDCLGRGAGSDEMNTELLKSLIQPGPGDLGKAGSGVELDSKAKMEAIVKWSQDDFLLPHVAKLHDLGHTEVLQFLSGSDIWSAAPMDSWARVDFKAKFMAGDPPSIQDGSHKPDAGTWCLDPERIERELGAKAREIMDRFGLGNIRLSGFPSLERTDATLDSLRIALEHIAKGAGVPEKAMGLGGDFCIHVNADVGRASGYASPLNNAVCLSPDNGWRTLAHEWFHAFDASVGKLIDESPEDHATEAVEKMQGREALQKEVKNGSAKSEAEWAAERLKAYRGVGQASEHVEAMMASAAGMMGLIRRGASSDELASLAQEETSVSVRRVVDGLYDRFYKNRVDPGLEDAALSGFKKVVGDLMEGKAGLAEVSAWREAHLGERAELSKHYDAFVVAEKAARDSRVGSRGQSLMERFAKMADEQLSTATSGDDWTGYSNSSVEMSARAFEGNCFLDVPDRLRPYMVDGRDNSMYWPVGAERGANKDAIRAFLARGTMAMVESGKMSKAVLDGFDPSSAERAPTAEIVMLDLGKRLAEKRSKGEEPKESKEAKMRKADV